MGNDLTSLPNIGPVTAKSLVSAGIADADALRRLGAHAAYRALLENGERPHFIGYYVLCMTLQGRPWNDCRGEEKHTLRARFDELVTQVKGSSQSKIEAELDEIGLPRRAMGDGLAK